MAEKIKKSDYNQSESLLAELEGVIGYKFKNKEYLNEALRHSSYVNERRTAHLSCSERLEFLGDSVLSVIVSEFLFKKFSETEEGGLSSMRREIVDSESLAGFAKSINLGEYLLLGNGEEQSGGRNRQSNLEDAFEALIAAIYLDGGRDASEAFVMPFVLATVEKRAKTNKVSDPKSRLQEIVQRGGGESPKYVITAESGPDHNKHFECNVLVENNVMGSGEGASKKEAEKAAAEQALLYFGEEVL